MRAVVADGFGEAWALREVPDPTPGPRDLLVQVEASGICYTDVQQLENPAYSGAFPRIPGHEPVGKIVAVGDDVSEWSVGERVGVAYAQRWCGYCHHCTGGYYEHCSQISQTGITVDGGHAELMVMDAGAAVGIPAALDPIDAAPILCAGFTVYSGICDSELRPGERCAVVGVGGLGHLGIQYAAALGAEVLAVTSAVGQATRARGARSCPGSGGKRSGGGCRARTARGRRRHLAHRQPRRKGHHERAAELRPALDDGCQRIRRRDHSARDDLQEDEDHGLESGTQTCGSTRSWNFTPGAAPEPRPRRTGSTTLSTPTTACEAELRATGPFWFRRPPSR